MTCAAVEDEQGTTFLYFFCPACLSVHSVRVRRGPGTKGPMWSWNRSTERPSLQPGINLWSVAAGQKVRCHSIITNGVITFTEQTTHHLRGKSVPLPHLQGVET